jgi:hypothetical protein
MQTQNSSAADPKDIPLLFKADLIKALLREESPKTQTRRIIDPQPVFEDGIWMWKRNRKPSIPLAGKYLSMLQESPYQVGDRLYVRESMYLGDDNCWYYGVDRAKVMVSPEDQGAMLVWAHHKDTDTQSAIHMPKWAARTWREITDVRVQRISDISEEDAIAEGIRPLLYGGYSGKEEHTLYYHYQSQMMFSDYGGGGGGRQSFRTLWNQINGKWKAIRKKGELLHYIAYPWNEEDTKDKPDVRKEVPFLVYPNPWVWAVKFTTVLRDEGK